MVMEKVRLEEAMALKLEQPFRTWSVPGLHVEDEDIPQDADVQNTFVAISPDGIFAVGIDFDVKNDSPIATVTQHFIGAIANFSCLEELRKTFPQLFELEGELYAFP